MKTVTILEAVSSTHRNWRVLLAKLHPLARYVLNMKFLICTEPVESLKRGNQLLGLI